MKSPTVHRIGNRSTFDSSGRMKRFLVSTMCGRLLAKPLLVTDNDEAITCGACRRVWVTPKWKTQLDADNNGIVMPLESRP